MSLPCSILALLGALFAGSALAVSQGIPDIERRCSNSFVLTQVTDQYSARGAGVHEAYEFAEGKGAPVLVYRMELPALLGNAVYLCDLRLMAAVVSDPRLKPYGRLDIDEVRPGRADLPAITWWQRLTGQLPEGRKRYLTEGAAEFVLVLDGNLVVHDNALRPIPTASAPTGWRFKGPYDETSPIPGRDGSRNVSTTELIHFDPVSRHVVRRAPMSASCSRRYWSTRESHEFCGGDLSIFSIDLRTGARTLYLSREADHPMFEGGGAVAVPARWWAKGRLLFMNSRQVSDDLVIPRDIYGVTESTKGNTLVRLGRVPSETIEYAQGVPDGLLLVSAKERRIWLFDPDTAGIRSAPLNLSVPGARITAISHTIDHLLVAEQLVADGSPARSRIHILDRQLRPVHWLERPGYTALMTTSARPWKASVIFDGLHLIPYPGKTVGR